MIAWQIGQILLFYVTLMFSLILHDVFQSIIAKRLGDSMPESQGRSELDPRPHFDPMYSVFLPLVTISMMMSGAVMLLMAGTKPMPLNLRAYKENKHIALVFISSPLIHLFIAINSILLLKILQLGPENIIFLALANIFTINLIWMIFHFIPLPPFPTGNAIAFMQPYERRQKLLGMSNQVSMVVLAILVLPMLFPFLPSPFAIVINLFRGLFFMAVGY